MEAQPVPSPGDKFNRLVEIMARLRGPGGCPWDREQSFDTLKKYLLEETYEVLDSIDARDWPNLAEELGDLMLQPVFQAQLASEEGLFGISDSLDHINNKLIRRHPHIFGDAEARTAEDVKERWDEIKKQEKKEKGREDRALLDAVPRSLPALAEAQAITAKVAKVGFYWPSTQEVLDKLDEELAELRAATEPGHVAEEIGDILFVAVNLARKHGVDAEQALRAANAKFRKRFAHVESNVTFGEASLEEMEEKWQEAKRLP